VLTKLRATYTDLRATIVVNAPYNATQPYLLDNLRFSDSTLALVTVVDGSGHSISGLTVVAYNGSTPTRNTGVTEQHGLGEGLGATGKLPVWRDGSRCDDLQWCDQPVPGAGRLRCCDDYRQVPRNRLHGQDQCHSVGTCDPSAGLCSNPNKADGTAAATGTPAPRRHLSGRGLHGRKPVACQPLDGCHDPGICDQATGICSNPANPDGPACVVGDGWTPSTPLVLQAAALSSGTVRLTWNDVGGESAYT